MENIPFSFSLLSKELICHILSFLPLRQVLLMGNLNKSFMAAVELHLRLLKVVDFCEDEIIGYMPTNITDKHISSLLKKCPNVEIVRGLHPLLIDRWRLRRSSTLSVAGVIEALTRCPNLTRIETSHFRVLEAVSQHLPQVEIEGHFRNRNGVFPPLPNQQIKLSPFLKLRSLHLIGVQVPELTEMLELRHLCLQWVSFTRLHPFRVFSAYKLETFVMKHCIGPTFPLRYYPLFIALGFATELSRLELVRVPILSGMILRSVEEALRNNGFKKIRKLVIADCKGVMESDLGQLMIAASQSLEVLCVQASLTKDSLFVSLQFARCDFTKLKTLHLGYVDDFPPKGEWSNDTLLSYGLADVPDVPSSITDSGLKIVSELFPNVVNLTISNCQHIVNSIRWVPQGEQNLWSKLTSLILERCHCLRLHSFGVFLCGLEKIEVVILKNMFPEPPKGCSHVGLSAGTGLGLSSAVVSTRDEHIAVQGHHVEAEPENEFDPRDFQNQDDVVPAANDNDAEEELAIARGPLHDDQLLQHFDDVDDDIDAEVLQEHPEDNEVPMNDNDAPSCSRSVPIEQRHESSSSKSKRKHQNGRSASSSKRQRQLRQKKTKSSLPKSSTEHRSCCCKGASTSRQVCTCSPGTSSCSKKTSVDGEYMGPITRGRSQKTVAENASIPSCSRKGMPHKKTSGKRKRSKGKASSTRARAKFKKCKDGFFNEDDATQGLYVTNESLISFTVISCGISKISLSSCSHLVHLEAQSCRILSELTFDNCHSIVRANISHCRKIKWEQFISSVMDIGNETPTLVSIEPYLNKNQDYYSSDIEEAVLQNATVQDNIVLMHTFCSGEKLDMTAQEILLSFMNLLKHIAHDAYLFQQEKNSVKLSRNSKTAFSENTFPFGHISRLYDKSEWCEYEILSNKLFITDLWRKYGKLNEGSLCPIVKDEKRQSSFALDVEEMIESGSTIGKNYVGFLVSVNKK